MTLGTRSVGSVRSHHGVLERHRAGLRVDVVLDELEFCSLRGVGEQRQTTAKQHGDHSDVDGVDQAELEQAAEEPAAAEEPDVLARLRLQGRNSPRRIV